MDNKPLLVHPIFLMVLKSSPLEIPIWTRRRLDIADPPPGGDDRPHGAATRDPGVSDVGKSWKTVSH